ncbi:MAG: class I SAM-dependent methyltransferase, partial [Planctomycetes bacterium]|nr:class I SAM-dependent methyltransferase [Planctomycetota bacterium]
GVDLSLDGLARARARVRDPRARFVQGDLLSLPLLPGQFDVAFSLGVLHHTGDPEAALRRCAEALRPGGVLIAGVYSPVPWLGPVYAALRSVTTRLPLRLVWALSSIGAPLGAFPLVGRLACPWMSRSMSWKARWLDTFDWYAAPVQSYHTLDEVRGWFERTGILKGIEVASRRFGTLRARRTGSRDVTGASGAFPGLWPGGDGDG